MPLPKPVAEQEEQKKLKPRKKKLGLRKKMPRKKKLKPDLKS